MQERDAEGKIRKRELSDRLEDLKRQEKQTITQFRSRERDLSNCEEQLRVLSREGNSAISQAAMFGGPYMRSVLAKIARTQFRGPVIGPLGTEITIREGCEAMGQAIERCLWTSFGTFIVTNSDDEFSLGRILKEEKCNTRHTIVRTTVEGRYNVTPLQGVISVASALQISNDLVYNVLVDRWSIEHKIIVPTEEEIVAKYITKRGKGSDWKINGIREAYTHQGTVIAIAYGNYSSEDNRFPYKNILAKDSTAIAAQRQSEIVELRNEMASLRQQQAEVNREIKAVEDQVGALEKEYRGIGDSIRKASRRKTELEAQLAEAQDAQAIDTTDLEDELRELNNSLAVVDGQIATKTMDLKNAKSDLAKAQTEKKQAENELEELNQQMAQYEEDINKYIRLIADAKRTEDRARRDVEHRAAAVDEAQRQLDAKNQLRIALVVHVNEQCMELVEDWSPEQPPVLTRNDTEQKLKSKLKATQEVLNKEKAAIGLAGRTKASVTEKMLAAKAERDHCKQELSQLIENVESLEADYVARKKKWSKQLKHACVVVREAFDKYMQDKGQSGTVYFDHKEGLLTLHCQTENTDEKTLRSDVRQLSGGERSFTTLCLLLALGHVVSLLFILLDSVLL
jgi:chromosome segregation ATPase